MKYPVFKYNEPIRVLRNVAGINSKTFGDEPLQVILYQGQILGRLQFWRPAVESGFPSVPPGQEEEMLLSEGGRR